MRVQVETTPIDYYPYWIVPQGGDRDSEGNRKTEKVSLEILKGVFSSEHLDLDALVVTSDLQGMVRENEDEYLLGEQLPNFLRLLFEVELPQIRLSEIGVLLCGDLFATLKKRGGLGDVKDVWRKFKEHYKWVSGVAGNHDDFGDKPDFEAFKREKGIYYLNREIRKVDKIEIGGISGIIGALDKPNRLTEVDFLQTLKKILLKQPEMIVLHQGPGFPTLGLEGEIKIRAVIENSPPNLIFCGHCHWENPLVSLENGTQILNVDKRVVILINAQIIDNQK